MSQLKEGGKGHLQPYSEEDGKYVKQLDFNSYKNKAVGKLDNELIQPAIFKGMISPYLQKHSIQFVNSKYSLESVKSSSKKIDLFGGVDYIFSFKNKETENVVKRNVDVKFSLDILESVDEDFNLKFKVADLYEDENGETQYKKGYFLKKRFEGNPNELINQEELTKDYNLTDKYLYSALVKNYYQHILVNGKKNYYRVEDIYSIKDKSAISNILSFYIDKENLKVGMEKTIFGTYKQQNPKEKKKTLDELIINDIETILNVVKEFKDIKNKTEEQIEKQKALLEFALKGSKEEIPYEFDEETRQFTHIKFPLTSSLGAESNGINLVYRDDARGKKKIFLEFSSKFLKEKKFGSKVCKIINQPIKNEEE